MAVNNLSKTLKLLFLKTMPKFRIPHIYLSKSREPFLNNEKTTYHKNIAYIKTLLPRTYKNKMVKYWNERGNLINQPVVKYCTKAANDKDCQSPSGRHQFHKETEDSINEQIAAELNAAFSYLSMACYFGRTEIALPGCQGFFMNMYEEELSHAMVFINYLLMRGAYVTLCDVEVPQNQEWKSIRKAFIAAVEMEKFVKEKLVGVFDVAEKHKDLQVMDIVSTQFMEEQNRSICELARLLKKAEMAVDPVGEYLFDKMIYNSLVKKSKDNLMYRKKLDEESTDAVYK